MNEQAFVSCPCTFVKALETKWSKQQPLLPPPKGKRNATAVITGPSMMDAVHQYSEQSDLQRYHSRGMNRHKGYVQANYRCARAECRRVADVTKRRPFYDEKNKSCPARLTVYRWDGEFETYIHAKGEHNHEKEHKYLIRSQSKDEKEKKKRKTKKSGEQENIMPQDDQEQVSTAAETPELQVQASSAAAI